jgi:hypothetical protein
VPGPGTLFTEGKFGRSDCGNFEHISEVKGLEIKESVLSMIVDDNILHCPGPGVIVFFKSGPVTLLNLLKRVEGAETNWERGTWSSLDMISKEV